jgi:hypothetical protein
MLRPVSIAVAKASRNREELWGLAFSERKGRTITLISKRPAKKSRCISSSVYAAILPIGKVFAKKSAAGVATAVSLWYKNQVSKEARLSPVASEIL